MIMTNNEVSSTMPTRPLGESTTLGMPAILSSGPGNLKQASLPS